jgi:hypothetical protein
MFSGLLDSVRGGSAFRKKRKRSSYSCFAFQIAHPPHPSSPSPEAFTLYNSGTSEYTTKKIRPSVRGPTLLPRWRSQYRVNCHSLRLYPVLTMACSLQSIANFLYRWFSSQACSQPLIHVTSEMSAPKVGPADDQLAHMGARGGGEKPWKCAWLEHRTGLQSLILCPTIFRGGTGSYLLVPAFSWPVPHVIWNNGGTMVELVTTTWWNDRIRRRNRELQPESITTPNFATLLSIRPQHGPLYRAQLSISISGKSY